MSKITSNLTTLVASKHVNGFLMSIHIQISEASRNLGISRSATHCGFQIDPGVEQLSLCCLLSQPEAALITVSLCRRNLDLQHSDLMQSSTYCSIDEEVIDLKPLQVTNDLKRPMEYV